MSGLGLTSLIIPEEYDGTGFGYVGLGQVLEESGRTLTCSPLISTSLLAASALSKGGNDNQLKRYLPEIASGNLIIAMAMDERSKRYRQRRT